MPMFSRSPDSVNWKSIPQMKYNNSRIYSLHLYFNVGESWQSLRGIHMNSHWNSLLYEQQTRCQNFWFGNNFLKFPATVDVWSSWITVFGCCGNAQLLGAYQQPVVRLLLMEIIGNHSANMKDGKKRVLLNCMVQVRSSISFKWIRIALATTCSLP